jgi:hypothetical protein
VTEDDAAGPGRGPSSTPNERASSTPDERASARTIEPGPDGLIHERVHAAVDDEVVVFLVGMRLNALWKVHQWLPVVLSAVRMRREQDEAVPALLDSRLLVGRREVVFVQYWASFEALESYASDPDAEHVSGWRAYARRAADSDAVGIYHETYLVRPGRYETVYHHMPPHGLGAATDLVPASGRRERAAGRLDRDHDRDRSGPGGDRDSGVDPGSGAGTGTGTGTEQGLDAV